MTRRARLVALALVAPALVAAGGCGIGSSSDESSYSSDAGAPALAPYPDTYFDNPGVSPFVATVDDPLSTFALDVDTGSYTVARRFLEDGNLPDRDSVRVEEYVNYFDPGYPQPTGADLSLQVDGAPTPFFRNRDGTVPHVVRIGVQSREVADSERRDAALTFVIDTSGSMDMEERLELVKSSLEYLVGQLRSTDTVAVVTYGDSADVALAPTPVAEAATIIEVIRGLSPSGSTNAEDGLRLGYQLARQAYRQDGINRVVLASDGVANIGATGPESILAAVGQQAQEGVDLVTLGFGMGNYNDVLMEQLANQGDGFYAYVDSPDEARRLFGQELTSTLQTLAEEAKIQVAFDPATVSSYRLIGFENRALADESFRAESLPGVNDAGEIGAGHDVTALYEVVLAPSAGQATRLGTVNLRWTAPDTGEAVETSQEITTNSLSPSFDAASERFQLAALVAAWAEVLRGSGFAETEATRFDELARRADDLAVRLGDDRVDELARLVARAAVLD